MNITSDIFGHTTSWIERNQGLLLQYGVNIISALLVLVMGLIATRLFVGSLSKLMIKRNIDPTIIDFIHGLVKYTLGIVVFIAALSQVGVQTTSVIAILGAAGLAIGLSLKDSLSNFAAGILLIMLRPFRSGDYVEVSSAAGTVKTIQIFSTILTTLDNKEVVLPNASVMSSKIVNYSRNATRRIDLVIGISYDADLRVAKALFERLIAEDERILKDPAPVIAVNALADSSVNFIVRPWVATADYWPVHNDLLERFKLAMNEADIGIPYPQLDLHLHQIKE